ELAGTADSRAGVKRFGVRPEVAGRREWWEEETHRQKITFEEVEARPGAGLVARIADRTLPFGGTWTFDITPDPDGGSELRIREDGEVYNVIFRFMARFIFGYTSTMDT